MTLNEVLVKLNEISKQLDKPVAALTFSMCEANGLSNRQLCKYGGLNAIKSAHFRNDEKNLGKITELKKTNAYINKLESQVGQIQSFQDQLITVIQDKLKPLPVPKVLKSKQQVKKGEKRELVAMLNDTHYGLNVDAEEIDGLNSFSWTEASRRTAFFIREVNNYKPYRRNETKKLNLVLNGDLLAGIIHGLMSKTLDLWIHQVNGGLHILTHAIHSVAQNFEEVEIHCIGGNHEELLHKREGGGRVTQEHYDNYANSIFYALSVGFRNYKNVKFNVPKTPYLFFDLPAGRAMVCHGHNMFSKQLGNPGKSINVKSLGDKIRDFNEGERLKGRQPVKLVLFGHTHCFAHFITSEGVEVYNAPCLSGLDAYAHQLTINTNFIAQVVFESTREFILGDSRLIRLKDADKDKELDKIIPIYERELKHK